jgi:hypothetical protein
MAALTLPSTSFASYTCSGAVAYLGIDAGGNVVVAVGASHIHTVCNIAAQGSFAMTVSSCKAAYSSLVAARLVGKNMTVYYGDNGLTCETIPSWGTAPTTYFIQGPD